MDELDCMRAIEENLQALTDEAARTRVAAWVTAKYAGQTSRVLKTDGGDVLANVEEITESGQIPGIAKLSSGGDIQLTVRDFKARSANDAATRLVHVFLWATKKLTGRVSASSKMAIVPALRKYRCYDGNTRSVIARDKGIVRDGDELSLDFHAEQLAERFIKEILDSGTEGKWKPGSTKRRSSRGDRTDWSESA
ncbi:hypothetical protein DYQ86_14745 [Acidobacteria bacterium AB60]|nr:hypothetical protein DYQ86_14745 [Acidobacteria bacterium AB60]